MAIIHVCCHTCPENNTPWLHRKRTVEVSCFVFVLVPQPGVCVPPNPYAETLSPEVTVWGGGTSGGVKS